MVKDNEDGRPTPDATGAEARVGRRDALKIGSGLIMLSAGLAALVAPETAAAEAPLLSLHFFRKKDGEFSPIGSIALPAELAAKLRASDPEQVKVSWLRKTKNGLQQLAQHDLPGRKQLKSNFAKKAP